PKLEPCANHRLSWKVTIRKGFVDDRRRRFRTLVGFLKEAAFAQPRPYGAEVIASHHARERNLLGGLVPGLPSEQIKRRLVGDWQWNSVNGTRIDYARNCADLLQ